MSASLLVHNSPLLLLHREEEFLTGQMLEPRLIGSNVREDIATRLTFVRYLIYSLIGSPRGGFTSTVGSATFYEG